MIDQLNTLAEGWMGALGNASLQGGIALLVVWCVCRFVPRLKPAFKLWLWRIAWFKLLLGLFWTDSIELPLLSPTPNVSTTIPEMPFSVAVPEHPLVSGAVAEPTLKPASLLCIVWLFGVFGFLVHLVYQWNRTVWLKRIGSDISYPSLMDGIKRLPALRESSAISSPVLVGILNPVIIVPSQLVAEVSPKRFRMILLHELAHLRRRDLFWAWLPAICQAVFFFHPLIWMTRREWLLAQEMACDELALRQGTNSASDYGDMLIDLVASGRKPLFGAASILENTRNLKRRIQAMKSINTKSSRLLTLIVFIVIVAVILPWRIVAQDTPDDAAKRIQQLEKENAELRQALEKLRSSNGQMAAEISAAEADLKVLRNQFTDQHPKVRHAERRLQQLKEKQAGAKPRPEVGNEAVAARQQNLYREELDLAQKYADSVRKQFENGRTSHEEYYRAQKQLLDVKREMARVEANRGKLRELVEEEMNIVSRKLAEVRKLVSQGLARSDAEWDLQRELLKLKRELLMLE